MSWWADVVFPLSASVPSSSPLKKQTHKLQWVLLGEDLASSPTCGAGSPEFDSRKEQLQMGPSWNGPGIPLHGFSPQSQLPALYTTVNGVSRVRFAHTVRKNSIPSRNLSARPS